MHVQLETHGVVIPRNEVQTLTIRVRDAFARVSGRIVRMHVNLKDVNGPRGGRDKVCMLRAVLTDGREIIVRDRSSNLGRALARSIRRGRALITHAMKRRSMRHANQVAAGQAEYSWV